MPTARAQLRISPVSTSSSLYLFVFQLEHSFMMEFTDSGGFRSRRSYPSLHHISLAPLTPRFPIDDTDAIDNLNYHSNDHSPSGTRTPPASYLSSVSVPSTPPILSHSRSNSRSRHARSKSSSRALPLSDTNLHTRDLRYPLHHVADTHKKQSSISQGRRHDISAPRSTSDAEWMRRAGIALASSTREEKGQSWLSKRESSTSLVSDTPHDEAGPRHHHRTKSGSSRKSRSGASTPAVFSRSRGGSRRGSRAGLTMTALPVSDPAERVSASPGLGTGTTGTASPLVREDSSLTLPDFVDERIRAELAALQQRRFSEELYWDGEGSDDELSSEYSYVSDETPDEFDEADLQQLTRERGFGLGSWIDRLVEWTLFGVDEWPVAPAGVPASRIGTVDSTTTVTFEEPGLMSGRADDALSLGSGDGDVSDGESSRDGESNGHSAIEKPGTQGGWEDAGWLFRVMKRALV